MKKIIEKKSKLFFGFGLFAFRGLKLPAGIFKYLTKKLKKVLRLGIYQ